MRITILLLIVGVCIVSAKYLPYENESSILLRNKRSNSEESNASVESDNDSSDNEDDNDSGEQQIDKQRRKKEEEQRKLEEKKAKELRKQEEKRQKEERKRMERIEKEKRKEEEKQRKLLEKHEKQERKKEEKRLKELEKLRKEVLEEKSDEDGFLETEEENSVELGNIWRNHIYVKYGLTLASTHAEKKAVLDRYLTEELGLSSNSTRSERQRAIMKLIETKLQNDTESKEALRNQLLSQINSVTINNLRNKLNKGIEKLTNKTQILSNVTLPWVNVAQQNLEERKTFLQSISQFLSSVLPNWTTGTQNQNASVQQDVLANNNEVYISEGNTVATSGINEVNADNNVVSNGGVLSSNSGIEGNSNIAPIDLNNNAASDASSLPSVTDTVNSPTSNNPTEVQSSPGAGNTLAVQINVNTAVSSGIANDSNITPTDISNNATSDDFLILSISSDSANSSTASNVPEVQSSGASNIPAIEISVGTNVNHIATVPVDSGIENESNIASTNITNNAASDTSSVPSIINDTAKLPEASNVAEVQSSFGASNIPAVDASIGISVDSNTTVPSGDIGMENDSIIASQNINNNAASDASLVPPTSNDSANSPNVQLSGASNVPDAEINVETSVVSNAVVPSGESNVVITSNQSDPNNIVIPVTIDATVVESQNTGISSSNAGLNKNLINNQVDISSTISTIGDSVADNLNNEVNIPVDDSSNSNISASSNSNKVTNSDGSNITVNASKQNLTDNAFSNKVEIELPSNSVVLESRVISDGLKSSNINESNNSVVNNKIDTSSGVSSTGIKEKNEVIVSSRPTLTTTDKLKLGGVNADESNIGSGIIPSDINSNSNGLNVENEPSISSNIGSSIVVVSSKDKSQSTDPIIASTTNDIQDSIHAENTNSVTSSSVANLPVSSDPIITTSVDSSGVLTNDIGVESNSNIASITINSNVASDISTIPSIINDISTPPATSNPAEVQSSSGASDIPAVEINVGTTDSNNVVLSNSKVENTVNVADFITTYAPISTGVSIPLESNITESNNSVTSESLNQNNKENSSLTNIKTLKPTNENKASVTISNIASSDVTEGSLLSGAGDGSAVGIDGNVGSTNQVEISSSAPSTNINNDIGSTVNIIDIITTGAPTSNDVSVLAENSVTDGNNDNTSVSVNSDVESTVNIIDIITTGAPLSNAVSILPEQNITDINNNNVSVSSTRSVSSDSGISLNQPDTAMGINVVQNITITYPSNNSDMSGISNKNESSPSVVNNITVTTESIILNTAHQTSEQDTSVVVEATTQANINKSLAVDPGVSTSGGEAINNVNTASSDTITETSLSSTGSLAQDSQPLSTIVPVESSTSTQIDGITLPVEEGASVVEVLPQL